MFHIGGGGGWRQFVMADEKERPQISRNLLRRVAGYARPYTGQILIVLESMKMQNELKAPRAGTVGRIRVRTGDNVEQNQTLLSLT